MQPFLFHLLVLFHFFADMSGNKNMDVLENIIEAAWEEYLRFLAEHGIPLPENFQQAKLFFRSGFVYCMVYYYPDYIS